MFVYYKERVDRRVIISFVTPARFESRQGKEFSLLHVVQTGWSPPNLLCNGYRALFPLE
jgi:hypothetical protein